MFEGKNVYCAITLNYLLTIEPVYNTSLTDTFFSFSNSQISQFCGPSKSTYKFEACCVFCPANQSFTHNLIVEITSFLVFTSIYKSHVLYFDQLSGAACTQNMVEISLLALIIVITIYQKQQTKTISTSFNTWENQKIKQKYF